MVRCLVPFRRLRLGQLAVRGESDFRELDLYAPLRRLVEEGGARFRVAAGNGGRTPWNRALFLNLTFWSAEDESDVLPDESIDADVVAHVAWHRAAHRAFAGNRSADALLLGEAVASAFDLVLVGHCLAFAPRAPYLEAKVAALAEVAEDAGLPPAAFERLLRAVAAEPERAFEDLRSLLFRATTSLLRCRTADQGDAALRKLEPHRFAPLLHHFELSSWVLHVRSRAGDRTSPDPAVRAVDRALRRSASPLGWLRRHWLAA